jgi:serine/threonine-protein kinase
MYEMLTGTVPFDAPSITALTVAVVNREPEPPRKRRPEIPAELEKAVLRCLAKDPDERFGNVADVALAIAPFAPEHRRRLADQIERVVEAVRAREPLTSALDVEEAKPSEARPTRPTVPAGSGEKDDERVKTAATWSDASTPGDAHAQKLRRGAMLLAGAALIALIAVALARPWEREETRHVDAAPAVAPPTAPPSEAPVASTAASAAPSASTSTRAPPASKNTRRRRPDIYEGLDEDPYDSVAPKKRRRADPYE